MTGRIFFVLPVAGRSNALARVLDRIRIQCLGLGYRYQIVVIDDVCDDSTRAATAAAADCMALHVIEHRFPRGRSESLRDGLEWVADHGDPNDVTILMDSDDSHDPEFVPSLLTALDAGAEVAIASRFRRGSFVVGRSAVLRCVSRVAAFVMRLFLGIPGVTDYTSGFCSLRVHSLRSALEVSRGRLIDPALIGRVASAAVLVQLARGGATFIEVPFTHRCDRQALPPELRSSEFIACLRLAIREWLDSPPERKLEAPLPQVPTSRWEWCALAGVLTAALAMRLYAIDRIPGLVIHDECDNLVNVYQILNERGPGLFGLDWKPQPAASVYLLSLFMRASMSLAALRLPAALFSVAALIPFYLLLRRAVAAPAALLATALLATDTWYLHFSRTGWENVEACLFLLAAAVCMRSGLRTGALRSFALAGMWSALGLYGPFAGRSILPAVLLVGIASLRRPSIGRRRLLLGLLTTATVAVALFAPQMWSLSSRWDGFQKRTRAVYILGGENEDKAPLQKAGIVLEAFGRKGYQIFAPGFPLGREHADRYLPIETGALARPTAALLAIGLLVSLFWSREARQWWLLFLVSFFMTEAITLGNLNGARGVVFLPVLYLFVGLTLQVLWTLCGRLYAPSVVLVVAGALALSGATASHYLKWVQSPELLSALEPSVPVAEFSEWQDFVVEWTAKRSEFYNVDMWKARKAELRSQRADADGTP